MPVFQGVDVNAKAYSGDTARSMALFVGHTKIVSLIDNATSVHRPVHRRGKNTGDEPVADYGQARRKPKSE